MNKLTHLETLLEAIRDDDNLGQEDRDTEFDMVDSCVGAYVQYHNEAVNQGRQLTVQRFRMEFADFAVKVDEMHERRKALHQDMISRTAILNQLCEDHGLAKIYDGPLDVSKGRGDKETRFGVAEFSEKLCRDLFRTTDLVYVPSKAHEAYRQHAETIMSAGSSWSAMQRMLEQADARSKMDSAGYEKA